MAGQKHLHKYSRKKIGKDGHYVIMACVLPDCTHYLPIKLAAGKNTECFGCGEGFVMTINDLKLKPACENCKPKISDTDIDIANNVLRNLGIAQT